MTINFLNIIQVLVGIALIGFILIQRGPGATAGSAFGGGGGGASGTVFGAKGSGSFLTKATAILATAFFIVTMLIAIDSREMMNAGGDVTEQDLGVMGSIDSETNKAVVIPGDDVDSSAEVSNVVDDAIEQAADKVSDEVDEALTQVKDQAVETVDNVAAATEAAVDEVKEKVEDAVAEEDGDQ